MTGLLLAFLLAAPEPFAVRFPDLSGLESAVAGQLGEMQRLLAAQVADAGAPPVKVAGSYGDLGHIYLAYGFNDAAADCFQNASRLDPQNFRWPYLLGAAQQAAGRLDEGAAAFEKVLTMSPALAEIAAGNVHLGEIRLLQGRLDDAEAALHKALDFPPTAAASHSLFGQVALARRDFRNAAEHLEAALAAVPEASRLHVPLAMAYRGLGDRAKAGEHLAKAGAVGLRAPDPLLDALADLRVGERVAVMRGRVAAQAGRYQDAAQEFRRALAVRPESVEARVNLGSVLALAGDRSGAMEQLREALRLDPANFTAHFNLGSLLAEGGTREEARVHLEAAVAGRPEDAEARRLLAKVLRDGGQLPAALAQYRRAVELAPGDEAARLGEAETLVRLGRYAEARLRLDEALGQMPGSGLLAHAEARLLAASPDPSLRDGERALKLALAVWQAQPAAFHAETVALALAELGRCDEAATWQRTAAGRAQSESPARLAEINGFLAAYMKGPPCRP
ncbi:MAG TPA: tetratricopeptide repeat protein [Thermoanaerobaculia bacterium]|jgi:tetratricopeptide (TPR) repeat protein|nr:tetratricopeptide repeat protein [Thermoanaerobaculia bacterium]